MFVLLLALGCEADPIALRLDVPISPGDRSAIVGIELGSRVRVHAAAISAGGTIDPIAFEFALDEPVAVTGLLYDRELADLDLTPGPLVEELDPARQRPIPTPGRIQRTVIAEATALEWREEADLPPALLAYRIPSPDPCGGFDAEAIPLGDGGEPTFALALDDRWALIGASTRRAPSESPHVFFADRDGNVVKLDGMPSSFFDGYREDGGTFWLGGERGVVYRATFVRDPSPRLDVVASSTVVSREDIISIVGPASGSPREQFALTTNRGPDEEWGAFEWFDGAGWSVPGLRRNTPHDATWVEAGFGLFASFYRDQTVYGARDGVETSIDVTSLVFGSVIEIESMPGLGLVAGTSAGEVHLERPGGGWVQISSFDLQPVIALHRYEGGIVFANGNSLVRWIDPDRVCDGHIVDRAGIAFQRSIAVVGRDVVVPLRDTSRGEDTIGEQYVGWFRAR
jgi:hypothetical protein